MTPTLERLRNLPGAERAYLVGGCVRDALLGRPPRDYDLAVQPPVRPFAEEVARRIGGRCVDLGKPGRQIIRVVSGGLALDLSPINGPGIEADLLQRDFTINALARRLSSMETVDCTGGRRDLERKTIRMVSSGAFMNDPVRLIRAYRLAACLDFRIDPETTRAIRDHAPRITGAAGERIRIELIKILAVEQAVPWITQMARTRLLFHIFPELAALEDCPQTRHHDFNVWEHTLRVFEQMEAILIGPGERPPGPLPVPPDLMEADTPALLKLAALLHDIGKPVTRKEKRSGVAVFHGHASRGAQMTVDIAWRLKLSTREREVVTGIVRHHLDPLLLFLNHEKSGNPDIAPSGRAVARFFLKCGPLAPLVLLHALADHQGKTLSPPLAEDGPIRFFRELLAAYVTDIQREMTRPPLITGDDLMQVFGLRPGPEFKRILAHVEEARLAREASSREDGLKVAAAYLAAHGRGPETGV